MTYPLAADLAADGIPVTVTCRVLRFSKQACWRCPRCATRSGCGIRRAPWCTRTAAVPVPEVRKSITGPRFGRLDGRVGACSDNAAMESFVALLQNNVLDRHRWRTRDDLRLAIVTWIERTYHRRRRQRRLGRLTPIKFETINRHATAA
jgi:putative transposase